MATLGISTNTRLLGLAIIEKDNLIDYAIHLHKSSWSPLKADKIITSLEPCVRRYSIKKVVLSIPCEHHTTKGWKYLAQSIHKHFESLGIEVSAIKCKQVYSHYVSQKKNRKIGFMKALTNQFPELNYYHAKELRNRRRYYINFWSPIKMSYRNFNKFSH